MLPHVNKASWKLICFDWFIIEIKNPINDSLKCYNLYNISNML